jgi:pyroglutamyl-peptidase
MWDGMPLGLKAAGVNVRIVVDDVRKVVKSDAGEIYLEDGKKR